jgi:hypothetical protein
MQLSCVHGKNGPSRIDMEFGCNESNHVMKKSCGFEYHEITNFYFVDGWIDFSDWSQFFWGLNLRWSQFFVAKSTTSWLKINLGWSNPYFYQVKMPKSSKIMVESQTLPSRIPQVMLNPLHVFWVFCCSTFYWIRHPQKHGGSRFWFVLTFHFAPSRLKIANTTVKCKCSICRWISLKTLWVPILWFKTSLPHEGP